MHRAIRYIAIFLITIGIGTLTHALLTAPLQYVADKIDWLRLEALHLHQINLALQALVILVAVHRLGAGPPLRTLFRPHLLVTLSLSLTVAVAAVAVAVWAAGPLSHQPFLPLNPFTAYSPYVATSVVSLIVVALQEEMLNRGFLQSFLAQAFNSPRTGFFLSALLFTIAHPLENAVFVLPGALLLGLVFQRTQSVLCTFALHLTLNTVTALLFQSTFTLSVWLPADAHQRFKLPFGLSLLAIAVAFGLLHRRLPCGLQHHKSPRPGALTPLVDNPARSNPPEAAP